MILEGGTSFEMMSENSTHGFLTASVSFVAKNFLLVRGTVFNGTKSRFNNLKSPTSLSYMLEGHIGKGSGLYLGYDYGLRNYRFESTEQFDAETGASSAQPSAIYYTPETLKPNIVLQHSLPTYRIGIDGMFYNTGKQISPKESFVGQFAIFYAFSPKAQKAEALFSESSLYNINVPTAYNGGSADLKASKRGFGFLLWGQSYYAGMRMEIGMRPTLYKNSKYVTNSEKGFYFHMGFSLRLI